MRLIPKYKLYIKQSLGSDDYIIYERKWFRYRRIGCVTVRTDRKPDMRSIDSQLRLQGMLPDTGLGRKIYDSACMGWEAMQRIGEDLDRWLEQELR